ncbi:N-acetyltransferase [Kribbella pittospori]|uniref:N-acetyltransferase n=1 Tax=Kribbella pittospori TaxID=722689 RepID=A0A4R0JKR8_9ACTN|nr:N-acetyltransferase [Kribbella pittospori]
MTTTARPARHWAITTDGKQAQGEVLLNCITGSIGYIVGVTHRGMPLASRALRAITDYSDAELGLPRLILEIEPDNQPSIAVARSAGLVVTATQPETVTDKGRTYTLATWEHTPDPRTDTPTSIRPRAEPQPPTHQSRSRGQGLCTAPVHQLCRNGTLDRRSQGCGGPASFGCGPQQEDPSAASSNIPR